MDKPKKTNRFFSTPSSNKKQQHLLKHSAMTKRNRESLSPPLPEAKKRHRTPNGTHQPHLSSTQKAKQKMKQGVPGQRESIPITKDEEEVAETLFALARMIPDKPVNYQVDRKSTEAKPPPVQQSNEVPMLASEASKDDSAKSPKEDIIVEATNVPSSIEGSGSDAVTVNFLPDTSMMHRPSIFRKPEFMLDRGIIGPLSDSRISQLQKNEHTDLTSLSVASTSGVLINPCNTKRRIQGTQHKASICEPKTELWPVGAILKKQEEHSMKENNDGDKRVASCMEAGDGVLKEKANSDTVGKTQPWKKCATHVHISRLIRVHQASEERSMLPPITNQVLPNGTKHGASAPSSLNGLISLSDKNRLNRFMSIDGCLNDGDARTNMNEVRNRIHQDKQNRDFLSLSTGGGGSLGSAASFNTVNQRTNKLDSSVQFHVPYLHPVVQNLSHVPFNVHGRSSSLYPDHLTVRATQQVSMGFSVVI
ncbi:hypothetical protein C5167_042031 [Papaver somniferum]|nr:hypothetical protein C5167_042031 [Papaver somniferum]